MGHGRLVSEILNLWKAVSFIGRRRGLKACPVTVVKSWVGGGRGVWVPCWDKGKASEREGSECPVEIRAKRVRLWAGQVSYHAGLSSSLCQTARVIDQIIMHADRHGLEGSVDFETETTVMFSLPLCVYIYFLKINLIHFWLCWVFVAAVGLSLVAESRGVSSWWLLLLQARAVAVPHGLSCPEARGIFPDQGQHI